VHYVQVWAHLLSIINILRKKAIFTQLSYDTKQELST